MPGTIGSSSIGSTALGAGYYGAPTPPEPQLYISGTLCDRYVPRSFRVNDRVNDANELAIEMDDPNRTFHPKVGEKIEVFRLGLRKFSGQIYSVRKAPPRQLQNNNRLSIRARDWTELTKRHLVSANYEVAGQTLKDIVTDLVNNQADGYLADDGVTLHPDFPDGPEIEVARWQRKYHRQAFDDLAKSTGYLWLVDYDKRLLFYDRSMFRAEKGFGVGGKWRCISIETTEDRDDYRNEQWIEAGKQEVSPPPETFKGDGENRTFTLKLEVANLKEDPPTIKVNDVEDSSVGIQGVDSEDDYHWFYARGDKQITHAFGETALSSADKLEVTYKGYIPIVILDEADDEIAAQAAIEGTTGRQAAIDRDDKLNSLNLAIDKAEHLIRRFGTIQKQISIITDLDGYSAGQIVIIEDSGLELSGDYLIESVASRDEGLGLLRKTIKALSGEPLGGWAEFFRMIIAQSEPVTIGESDKLVIVRRREDTIGFQDSVVTSSPSPTLPDHEDDSYSYARMTDYGNGVAGFRIGFARIGRHPLSL